MLRKVVRFARPFLGLAIFGGVVFFLARELRSYDLREVLRHIRALPLPRALLCLGCSLASYAVATGYDVLGARYALGKPLPYSRIARAAFSANTIANSTGFGVLTGGSVRYRMYTAWGLEPIDIGRIIGFCALSLWLGFFCLGGVVFTVGPLGIPNALGVPFSSVRPLGIAFLCLVGGYGLVALLGRKSLRIGRHELALPAPRYLPAQIAVGIADWGLAGLSLYIVLSGTIRIPYGEFMAMYALAIVGGVLSQVPGGLGVFETAFVLLLSGRIGAPQVLGSMLVYRGLFYFVPLLLGLAVLAAQEIGAQRRRLGRARRAAARGRG